jgi:hypothetical protein
MSEANSSPYIANMDSRICSFYVPPKPSGFYRIGGNHGLSISFVKKPNWFHRKMMALCLGWEWQDGSPL